MHQPLNLPPAVAGSLASWHAMIAAEDLSEVAALLHEDAVFCSPAYWRPYPQAFRVAHVLQIAVGIFDDFTYHRQFATGDGHHVVLEFAARLGDLELKGIDMIEFDADGLITRFEVMIRPLKSLEVLAGLMRAAVDLQLLRG